jgi:hypothetical protein
VINPALQRLMDHLPQGTDLEFVALLEAIDQVRFTGALTVDFRNGRPVQINLGQPVKLTICTGDRNGAAGSRLDKPGGIGRG